MIKLLGIPHDNNSSFLKGSALAPQHIRQMDTDGSANQFCERGMEIKNGTVYTDIGDMVFNNPGPKNEFETILETVRSELVGKNKMLLLGGDHSISFPVIKAFSEVYPDLHILHLDAHADLYENFGNNPYSHASPFARLMEANIPASLTQVGIRTLNTHQSEQVRRYQCKVVEMKDFSFSFLESLQGPLYVSVDLDVLDPAFAPGLSHHEPGGLNTRELIKIIQSIPVLIVGADIVELNPIRDVNHMTAMVAYKLMKELISKMIDS